MRLRNFRQFVLLSIVIVAVASLVAGCGADGKRSTPAVDSSAVGQDEGFDTQVKDAVYAVFDSPIDRERAASFVCPEVKASNSAGSDWNYEVDRYEVKARNEESASVDVVLRAADGTFTTLSVGLVKAGGKWVICD